MQRVLLGGLMNYKISLVTFLSTVGITILGSEASAQELGKLEFSEAEIEYLDALCPEDLATDSVNGICGNGGCTANGIC